MRKVLFTFCLLFFVGCTSAQIPAYLQDKQPYTKKFYANYDQTMEAVSSALKTMGWHVEQIMDAGVYEHTQLVDDEAKDSLIITNLRQMPLFLGTRYAKMNIYVRSKNEESEVELRYVTITSLPFRNIEVYKNDAAAERIFTRIEDELKSK